MKVPPDWRSALVYVHRWLGIAGCLLFIIWFLSGVVLMYARMPSLTAEERLAHAPALDLSTARVEPAAAIDSAGFTPTSVRLSMLGARPVYRMNAGRAWSLVYADTGETLETVTASQALDVSRAFSPSNGGTLRHDAYLLDSDQWTLSSAIRSLMPLYRISLGDVDGTMLYVSARTAEPVMKTTRHQRLWGYLGAVLHWLYFTPLRRHSELWTEVIIWSSIAGSVMCLSGLVWGIWRFSPSARFRLKRQPAHSPYAGMMKWHHYAGLFFGLTTTTWIFSGLMSMTPWDWSPGNSPTRQQREAVTGGPLRVEHVTIDLVKRGLTAFAAGGPAPKELEVVQFRGAPFLVAYVPPDAEAGVPASNTDMTAAATPVTFERRFVSLSAPERGTFARFDPAALAALAPGAMPQARPRESVWLTRYDSYYYDRTGTLSLPVLRVKYDDSDGTWLYFDPRRGAVVQKEVRRTRLERWLYHGLHSLDFPVLYYRRPLWDIVLVVLSVGGLVSSATTLTPAWRRLRRAMRRLVRAF